jgi:general secretion pathway protein K
VSRPQAAARAAATPCPRRAPAARRQRGVALIAAVLVVALAVVLVAALLDTGEATRARSRNSLRAEQTWQLMLGLEAWAIAALMRDEPNAEGGVDSAGEPWAQPMPPLAIPGGRIHGRLREQSGCFNLNSLWRDDLTQDGALAQFGRLLRALALDPRIADHAHDWIDSNATPRRGGAEDLHYLQLSPAYRAANQPFTHVSELRLLPGIDGDAYARLAPHVCAQHPEAKTNLNFAAPVLWMSLHEDITESVARRMARDGQARHLHIDDIAGELLRNGGIIVAELGVRHGVRSEYFVAEAELVVDGIPYAYASLLRRDGKGGVHVIARTRGRL